MKNRFLSLITVITLLFFCAPIHADYHESYGDYIIEIEHGQVEIIRYKGTESSLTIPNTINGKDVVKIGEESFSNNKQLENIILPTVYNCYDCTIVKFFL